MKIGSIFFLFLCPLLGFSQSEYSPETLQEFTNLYLGAKSIKVSSNSDIQTLFTKHNITPERYRAILHQSLKDRMPELASNELAFIEELKRKEVEVDRKKELALKEFCDRNEFDFSTYQEIEKKYKSDIKFQSSLQPYFNNSLKQIR